MSFGASLTGAKVDNHAASYADKVEIRERVLAEIGADKAHVLDCFAGSGHMHRAVWSKAASYVGCDMRFFFDKRTAFVCDNRILLRSIDLGPFNVFDVDAYGSPWEQLRTIAARRRVARGEKIGIVITDGSGMKLKLGRVEKNLAAMADAPRQPSGAYGGADMLSTNAIAALAQEMRCTFVRRWHAERRQGAPMRYDGIILRGA